jgi:hypothetical protein
MLVGIAGCGSSIKAPPQRLTPKQIVERSKPAIVQVEAGGDRMGTGFILDRSGVVATNLHVVVGAEEIKVRLVDGTVLTVPRVIAVDADHDLALLDVDARTPLPTLLLGDSDKVAAGDPVLAIGNPLGLGYTVSDGLISSVRQFSEDVTLLQISAPISQGSSGGPLFNNYGEVIGVATAIFAEGQNLNFGVPSNYVRKLMVTPTTPVPIAEFAKATKPVESTVTAGDKKIVRKVPKHDLAIFKDCEAKDIGEAVKAVSEAIELGAPLYNQGNHEACYRIYEGASSKLEHDSPCKGVREAFGAGLLRASTLDSPTEKAWALRDTFDGLIEAAMRYAQRTAGQPATP